MKTVKTPLQIGALSAISLGWLIHPSSALAAGETLFPDSIVPVEVFNDAPNWELGTVFRASAPGSITHVRVFSIFEESGDHEARIWRNLDNTLVAGPIPWSYGGDEAWITLDIDDVPVEANTDYRVSVSVSAEGWYVANAAYFDSAGDNGQHLSYSQGAGVFSATAARDRPRVSTMPPTCGTSFSNPISTCR
jgi:hypothetical protein